MKARRKLEPGKLAVGFPAQRDEAVLNAGGSRCESVVYDFSKDGGAVGTIKFGRMLPAGAVVIGVVADEITAVTGADDITLKAGSTALVSSKDFTSSSGIAAQTLAGSATAIKIATESELQIAIATNAATAGKVRFFVRYLLPND